MLSDANTEHILSSNNLNEAYENFEDIIVECVDKSSVVRRRRSKNHNKNKWFDNELLKLKEKRDRLYKDYVKNGRKEISKLKFNKTKKIYEKMIKSKKETYYQNILTQQKYNMKNIWRTLNRMMGKEKQRNA